MRIAMIIEFGNRARLIKVTVFQQLPEDTGRAIAMRGPCDQFFNRVDRITGR